MTGRSERRPGDLIDHRASTDLTLAITSGQTSAISVFGRTGVRGRANVRSRDRPESKQRAPAAGASTASAVIMAMSVQCAASLTETSRLRRCCTTDHTDRVHLVLVPTAEPRSRLNAVVDDHCPMRRYTQGDSDGKMRATSGSIRAFQCQLAFARHLVGKTLINVFHRGITEIRFVGKLMIIRTFS